MKICDSKHEECGKIQKYFGDLKVGSVFLHGGRALMKIEPYWLPIVAEYSTYTGPPIKEWKQYNAIRLGHFSECNRNKDGYFSAFDGHTEVTLCPNATIYLKG